MTLPNSETPPPVQPGEGRVPVFLRTKAKKPLVTYIILGVTILMFALQYLSQTFLSGMDLPFVLGGKINEMILRGQIWRLLTPMLLHGGLLHLAFNMYALFIIGRGLEHFYGHWRYLVLYLIAGYTGNVLSFLFSANPSLGASTAIFGLAAAQGVLILKNRKLFGNKSQSMLINLGLVLAINLSLGFSANSGIDYWGHIGGLVGGAIFAWVAGPKFMVKANNENGIELVDMIGRDELRWAVMLSAGLFTAGVIGKFIAA
ncbi:MAG: rhomboid family intramembrane serine protease [Anaerolineae bacterium]|nr:rhomboid family intramembrane serine protease [Anaerolineae bacterium]